MNTYDRFADLPPGLTESGPGVLFPFLDGYLGVAKAVIAEGISPTDRVMDTLHDLTDELFGDGLAANLQDLKHRRPDEKAAKFAGMVTALAHQEVRPEEYSRYIGMESVPTQ
jgi:hypothetical protein